MATITNVSGGNMRVRIIQRRLTLLSPVMVMFFTVGGVPYGLEDLVGYSGPSMDTVEFFAEKIVVVERWQKEWMRKF